MENRPIERPDVRWRVFSNIYQLMNLRRRIETGSVTSYDIGDLVEIREMLNDDISAEPPEGGFAFFDSVELQVFRNLIEHKIDVAFLLDGWEKNSKCLHAPEFSKFLGLAGSCMETMMAEGRGLPGWNQHDSEYESLY